jgi:hypothetical protein
MAKNPENAALALSPRRRQKTTAMTPATGCSQRLPDHSVKAPAQNSPIAKMESP